jgi:hypothetical protein
MPSADNHPANRVSRFRPWRFSLRTLLLVVTVTLLVFGWRIDRAKRQAAIVEKLRTASFAELRYDEIFKDATPVNDSSRARLRKSTSVVWVSVQRRPFEGCHIGYDNTDRSVEFGKFLLNNWELRGNFKSVLTPLLGEDLAFHFTHRATSATFWYDLDSDDAENRRWLAEINRLPFLRTIVVVYGGPWISDQQTPAQVRHHRRLMEQLHKEFPRCRVISPEV